MKRTHRRQFLQLTASAAALATVSRIASAQSYPMRPARILVGFTPGGTNDLHARLIGQWLSERLGQQFVVENRAGAGGNLAAEAAIRSAPDGYTLYHASSADSWNATLYNNLRFNFVRDIVPVASFVRSNGVLVTHPAVTATSVAELIAYAKVNPGKLTVASAGIGSAPHIYWELFRSMAGVEMLHVPYRGGPPALTDLLAGQVQVMFATIASSIDYVRSGKLRAVGVTCLERSEALPDVPPISHFVPGYEAVGWQGIVAPKDTSAEIVDRLNKEITRSLGDTRMQARLAQLGSTPFASSSAEFGRFIAEFTYNWGKVIRAANIKTE